MPTPTPAPVFVNHALARHGTTVTASSKLDDGRAPEAAINGDRRGLHWGSDASTGSGWHDADNNTYPDWLEVSFNGPKSVSEVHVFSVQDNYAAPSEPTEQMLFTKYGVTGMQIEFWDGAAWRIVPNGLVVSNNKVWAKVAFEPLTTTKLRVVVNAALAGHSRLTEVEAWGVGDSAPPPPPRVNHALSSNGATVAASSFLDDGRAPQAAVNGDRRGLHWGSDASTGSGWHDSSGNDFPDWLEINFGGEKTLSEVHVFTVQDNYAAPSEPTEQMPFTKYGLTEFDVEYWSGSAWQVVPGGAITGNNKVWRKLTFPALKTSKIRVVIRGALAGHSRVTEVEAY
jgi:hypothetical protein